MKSSLRLALLPLLLAAAPLSAAGKLDVVSLTTVLADIARNVGADNVVVTNIIQPGIDPHTFEPSVGDIRKISEAELVLASGLGFESFLSKLETSVGGGPVFLVVGKSITPIMTSAEDAHDADHHEEHHHAAGHAPDGKIPDPHWWHSIDNAIIATGLIRDAFSKADPDHAAQYAANAAGYVARLRDLEKWANLEIAKLPRDRRILVTSHDALGYFARDYGFELHPVEGISTSDQPSSKKVRALIDEIQAGGVKAIFAENIENPKVLEEITRETGAKLGGTLYADGLGATEAGTYESMMRHNVETIVAALQ
jgi:zinc/manganese transport system substrate-binding protein